MNMQRLKVEVETEHNMNSAPMGDYGCEACIADSGELLIRLFELELSKTTLDGMTRKPGGKFYNIRFNRYETQKIRSALGKGG